MTTPSSAIRPRPAFGGRSFEARHPGLSGTIATVAGEDVYAGMALREATAAGFTPREVAVLLAGQPVTALVPPLPDEPLGAYADRATSELFIRAIAARPDTAAGWT